MNEQETTTDIIAWLRRPREGENGYLTAWRDEIADRLEAAHKREAAFHAMTCEANDRLREHLQIALDADKRERGDCAKLREALMEIRKAMMRDSGTGPATELHTTIDAITQAALAAPPRNCDVGTAEEQAKRLNEWCSGRHCINCQFRGGWPDECKLKWAQTPYKEGDDK